EHLDLIAHQRDQRRDHERRARQQARRKLVREALAPAGRSHEEQATAGQERLDRFPLTWPERAEAELAKPGLDVRADAGVTVAGDLVSRPLVAHGLSDPSPRRACQ